MDYRSFTLLFLLGCSQGEPTPIPLPLVASPATKAPEPWEMPGWFPRTVAETALLQQRISGQLDAVVIEVEKTDPVLAADLRAKVTGFRNLVPSMVVGETPNHEPIFAQDGCTREPCEHFVSEDMAPVAAWGLGMLCVNHRALNSEYIPYIVFHELYHRDDPTVRNTLGTDRMVDVPNPIESSAWDFQSRVMNTATGGAYHRLVRAWAGAVHTGDVPSVSVGTTVNAEVPSDFAALFNRDVGNSDLALQGLTFMFQYDLNRELIRKSRLTEAEQAEPLALLYNRLIAAPISNPDAATIVRESMQSWRRTQ